jgi:hypothetical protein
MPLSLPIYFLGRTYEVLLKSIKQSFEDKCLEQKLPFVAFESSGWRCSYQLDLG